ncbi:hypothetical protein CHARACLAT_009802 [Characodon lateralis]|uniref:Uncharacterized protein n=1 Tax=Characodon lateralis TaxID=208331 RepID=A0ABU7EHS2_9TELE|nr:hypothetical protein [Characodon lateralis]
MQNLKFKNQILSLSSRQAALTPTLHVRHLWSVPRLNAASICDQCWRQQTHVGRKREPKPHCGHYRSGRTFLITELVKKGCGVGRWEYLRDASCVKVAKKQKNNCGPVVICGAPGVHESLWIHLVV